LLEPLKRLAVRDRLRFLPSLRPGARVFDVGTGDGRLLVALARRGYAVSGAEPYRAASVVAGRPDVPVLRSTLEDLTIPHRSQDAIILWHVLEHLPDPEAALRRVLAWTVPGGTVVVAVPNAASVQARMGGDRWFQQDVPRHLLHFTPRGLTELLQRAGFEIRRSRQLVLDQSLFAMWQTLLNRLTREPNVAFALVRRQLPQPGRAVAAYDVAITAVAGLALLVPAVIMELAAAARGAGGSIVAEAVAPRE
jgi:SAM-dependent methyltransferase